MKKVMRYETPEIEVTRFELTNKIMTVVPGGSSGEDGNTTNVSEEFESVVDETLPLGF